MVWFLKTFGIVAYLCLGIIFTFMMESKPDTSDVIVGTIFWPLGLLIWFIMGIGYLIIKIGIWLHYKLFKRS